MSEPDSPAIPLDFPQTEAEAAASAAVLGTPPQFAVKLWHLASSRGWRDSKGIPLRNWMSYLAASVAFAREEDPRGRRAGRAPPDAPGPGGERLRAPLL